MSEDDLERSVGTGRAARLSWLLEVLRSGGGSDVEKEARCALEPSYASERGFLDYLAYWRARLGVWSVVDVGAIEGDRIEVRLRDGRRRGWRVSADVAAARPHTIASFAIERELARGLSIREASGADGALIEQIERASPIALEGGGRTTLIRGQRLLDQLRMMGDGVGFVVEEGVKPVACDAIAAYSACIAGEPVRLAYRHHTRVIASHQKLGISESLVGPLSRFVRARAPAFSTVGYVDPSNESIRRMSPIPTWEYRPFRALLDCRALRGESSGRSARPADSAAVVGLLNSTHGGEELFLPYDARRLAERLGRLPAQYGWEHVVYAGVAVLGVWEAGERAIRESGSVESDVRRAYALDYGFQPDDRGNEAFERLLRSACARLADRGIDQLSIFSSPASPGSERIRELAAQVLEVEFQSWIPQPDAIAERGFYVDHLFY